MFLRCDLFPFSLSLFLDTLLFVLQPDEWLALFYSLPPAFSARRSSLVIVRVTDLGCQRLRHFVKRALARQLFLVLYETRVARGMIPHHVARPSHSIHVDPRRSSSRKCRRERSSSRTALTFPRERALATRSLWSREPQISLLR